MKKRLLACALISCSMLTFASSAAGPGTDDDPLISKSYIDSVVYPYIDSKLASAAPASAPSLEIVSLKAGNALYCQAGTEIILRSGSATIMSTPKGGLCDVTAGLDLPNGAGIAANHLLIVPVADGRGAVAASDCIFMVTGEYEIR